MQHDLDDIGGARELVWRRINVAKDDLEAAEMNMHIVLYGDLDQNGVTFADPSKETLLMLPALAVPSPNIYFKPLAEALSSAYNVVVIEPFGYGLSDMTESARTVENINSELYDVLETLEIDTCTLLAHSISGVYGLNFLYSYPEKVNAFIAIDNTVYEEELAEALAMEQDYMLQAAEKFDELRNTFVSVKNLKQLLQQIRLNMGQNSRM